MKKLILIHIFFIPCFAIYAQNEINTGLNIGYCSSVFVGDDIPGKGLAPVSSALIGGYFRYYFNYKFAVQPEINYCAKGSRINTIDNLYEYVYLDYLEIPVLFVTKIRNARKLQPIFYVGPALSINTVASGSRGYLNNVKKTDVSINAGTGVEIWKLSFQVRYCYGMVKFDNSNQGLDLRNSTISALVAFNFVNKK